MLVSRLELRCLLQGVSFFTLDAVLALASSAAGLSVGHAENVVSLDAAVSATVARNRIAQLKSLGHVLVHAVEDIVGLNIGLSRRLAGHGILFAGAEELLAVGFKLLVSYNGVSFIQVASVELLDSGRRDWLLQNTIVLTSSTPYLLVAVLFSVDSNDLSGGIVMLCGVVEEFLLHDSVVFQVSWLIDSSVEGAGA